MSEDVLARILAPQSYQSREQRVFGIVTDIREECNIGGDLAA